MATAEEVRAFIEKIAPLIQKESKERGYKVASPIIAQACIESAYGTSSLGYKYHNYFGMKCGSSWRGKSVNLKTKEEYTVGTLTTIRDNFRVYDSMEDGVKGYFDFISTKRYANLKEATSPMQYLEMIKADGYATSSTYVATNMNIVHKYLLDRYDEGHYAKPITPELIMDILNGEYGNGEVRKAKLTNQGYNYDDVRAKINELNKIGKEFMPAMKDKAGDYWKCVAKLMIL